MKIYLFDSWKLKFCRPLLDHWRALGHDVNTGIWWGPDLVPHDGLAYFYPIDNNLCRASNEQPKPPGTCVIAEAVDADIYGGHWQKVNWNWVDALVTMSEHMLRWMREHPPGLPDNLPIHIIPGGVDLDAWTMRREPVRGYNIAWVGHYWIAKNLFGALQVFNELIRRDPDHPWRLYVRGQKWSPNWWQAHCDGYLAQNPALAERVTFTSQWVPDLNEWLEDKHYLLSTSFKEAFGYAIGEAAAKGIRPVLQATNGIRDIWPEEWVFDVHGQAVDMFLSNVYEPKQYRAYIANRYPLSRRLAMLDEVCFG